jgi:hypothetical protein
MGINIRAKKILPIIGIPTSSHFPPFAIQPANQGVAANKYMASS